MIQGPILHPQVLKALGTAGHFSKILIADGNYPFATHSSKEAEHVYLNYSPGVLDVPSVLRPMVELVPVQAASAIATDDGSTPEIWAIFQSLLPPGITLDPIARQDFFRDVRSPETVLVVATAEMRLFACILLTVGLRRA